MHGASEGQVAAQSDGQIVDASEARLQRGQIGERLRRMHVAAIAGVDDGHGGGAGRDQRSSLLGVANRDHINIIGNGLQRIGDGLALGDGGQLGSGEADHLAAEPEHGGFEAQTGSGAGLIKQSGEHPAFAGVRHLFAMGIDVLRLMQQLLNLMNG